MAVVEKLKQVSEELNVMYGYSHLTLAGRDDDVARDQLGEDTTDSLDTESKRADAGEDRVFGTRIVPWAWRVPSLRSSCTLGMRVAFLNVGVMLRDIETVSHGTSKLKVIYMTLQFRSEPEGFGHSGSR